MSRTLDFSDFETLDCTLEGTDQIKGGTCTGGGISDLPGGGTQSWDSDETDSNGSTVKYGLCIDLEL
jgi:hypothetical protein